MTRDEAKLAGLKRYNSGAPCPQGHEPVFWTNNYSCVECARIREREKYRARRRAAGLSAAEKGAPPIVRGHAETASLNMPSSHLRQARSNGTKAAASHGDGRHEHIRAEAHALLNSFCAVPDFLARAEERIAAARAQS